MITQELCYFYYFWGEEKRNDKNRTSKLDKIIHAHNQLKRKASAKNTLEFTDVMWSAMTQEIIKGKVGTAKMVEHPS